MLSASFRRSFQGIEAEGRERSRRGHENAREHFDGRGFSGAVFADESDALAPVNDQVELRDRWNGVARRGEVRTEPAPKSLAPFSAKVGFRKGAGFDRYVHWEFQAQKTVRNGKRR
jgi:hypothetical protein